jgi:putative addiction module killer protein
MNFIVKQTAEFAKWLHSVKDMAARVAIVRRLDRVPQGNFGDHKSVNGGVSEMRIDVGAGYRVYYTVRGNEIVILLCGGDKKTQAADIARAKKLAEEY